MIAAQLSPAHKRLRKFDVELVLGFKFIAKTVEIRVGQRFAPTDRKQSFEVLIFGGFPALVRSPEALNVRAWNLRRVVSHAVSPLLVGYGKSYNTDMCLWITSLKWLAAAYVGGRSKTLNIRRVA